MVTSNVDAVYDGHVSNHARFVSYDVVNFISSVSIRASPCPSPPCFLLKLYIVFMILKLFDVAHSTRVSPISFRWPRLKHPVAVSDVFVCPPTFALKSPITIV